MSKDVSLDLANTPEPFTGFEPLNANFVYCPNQFFDYALRYCKRSPLRLVSHVLHATLRWRDTDGNPIKQNIVLDDKTLIAEAGISKGSIRTASKDALALKLVSLSKEPQRKRKGSKGESAQYSLRWDDSGRYSVLLDDFEGFYTGNGNRTPIPAQFFTFVIPNETVAVIKVVGAVIRHTIGYENQFGRLQQTALSISKIMEYTGLSDRATVVAAIQTAIQRGYIVCTHAGVYTHKAEQQQAASYAVRWHQEVEIVDNGTITQPEGQYKNQTRRSVQKTNQQQFKSPTSNSSISKPRKQYKNQTNIKKREKVDYKQEPDSLVVVLMKEGITELVALELVKAFDKERIQQQLDWLPHQTITGSRAGFLRRAIEQGYSEPVGYRDKMASQIDELVEVERQEKQAKVDEKADEFAVIQKLKRKRYATLLEQWEIAGNTLRLDASLLAYEQATTKLAKKHIEDAMKADMDNPPPAVLDALDQLQRSPIPTS